jgi:hypothetical protein
MEFIKENIILLAGAAALVYFYTNKLILVAVILGVLFFLNKNNSKKEKFTLTESEMEKIATELHKFIKPTTTFTEYLDFLRSIKNKSTKLLNPETFYAFKFLKKQNELDVKAILDTMKQ